MSQIDDTVSRQAGQGLEPEVREALDTPRFIPDRRAFRAELEAEDPNDLGAYGAFGAAAALNWSTTSIDRLLGRTGFEADPDFDLAGLTVFQRDLLTNGLDPADFERLEEAVSFDHAKAIRDQLIRVRHYQRQMFDEGVRIGLAASLTSAVGDPVNIITAGVGGAVATGARGIMASARGARAFSTAERARQVLSNSRLVSAAGGAAAGGAIEATVAASDPTMDADEAFVATLFGMAFGGGAGAVAGDLVSVTKAARAQHSLTRADAARQAQILARLERQAGTTGVLSEEGRRLVDEQRAVQREALEDTLLGLGFDDDELRAYREAFDAGEIDEIATRLANEASGPIGVPTAAMGAAASMQMNAADAFAALPEWLRKAGDAAKRLLTGEITSDDAIRRAFPDLDMDADELAARREELEGVLRLNERPAKQVGDFFGDVTNDARPVFGRVRFGMNALFGGSKSPLVRKVGNALVRNPVGTRGRAQSEAGSEAVVRFHNEAFARFAKTQDDWFNEWAESMGYGRIKRLAKPSIRSKFAQRVGSAARSIANGVDPGDSFTAVEIRAANAMLDWFDERLAFAQRHGLMLDVPDARSYFTRMYRDDKLDDMIRRTSADDVRRLFAEAIRRAQDVDEKTAERAGRVMFDTILSRRYTHLDRLNIVFGRDKDAISKTIKRLRDDGDPAIANLTDDEILRIGEVLAPSRRNDQPAVTARELRRVVLDEDVSITAGNGEVIGFRELLEDNADVIANVYSRQIAGAAVTKEILNGMTMELGRPILTVDDALEAVGQSMMGVESPRRSRTIITNMQTAFDAVQGRALGEHQLFDRFSRYVIPYNQAVYGGTFGEATIPEIGRVIGGGMGRAMLRNVPGMRNLMEDAKNLAIPNSVLREVSAMAGLSGELSAHRVIPRTDITGGTVEAAGGVALDATRRLARGVSVMSGQAHLTHGLKEASARIALANLDEWARTNRGLGRKRLASIGLDEAMADRIRLHANRVDPETGERVGMDFARWNDPVAASALIAGVGRWANTAVISNDIGSMRTWMTTPIARIILQFRSFGINAYESQLLRGIHLFDRFEFQQAVLQFGFAALAYTAQTYRRALTQEDPEGYIEERLFGEGDDPYGVPRWMRAAFQRAGIASFLPDIADSFAAKADLPMPFNARNSGLVGILGNPTFELIGNAGLPLDTGFSGQSLLADLKRLVTGEGSAGDLLGNQRRFVPGRSLPFVEMGLDAMGQSIFDE